jgi:hypothetical protein
VGFRPHQSMNIIVIDVLYAWGILLSRIWPTTLGGFLVWTLLMHISLWGMGHLKFYTVDMLQRII